MSRLNSFSHSPTNGKNYLTEVFKKYIFTAKGGKKKITELN
jgi:hypothetical protein